MCAEVIAGVKSAWRTIIGVVAGFLLGIIPFLVTYVPVIRQLGSRTMVTLSITLRSGTT